LILGCQSERILQNNSPEDFVPLIKALFDLSHRRDNYRHLVDEIKFALDETYSSKAYANTYNNIEQYCQSARTHGYVGFSIDRQDFTLISSTGKLERNCGSKWCDCPIEEAIHPNTLP